MVMSGGSVNLPTLFLGRLNLNVIRQSACSVILTQSRLMMALLPSLIAPWLCIRLNDGSNIKLVDLFQLVGTGLVLSVAWSFGVQQLLFSFAPVFQWWRFIP